MSGFQQKITSHGKRQGKTQSEETKQASEPDTDFGMIRQGI